MVRIAPGDDTAEVTFATNNDDELYHLARQVTFTVTRIGTAQDFSTTDERLLLPESPITVTIQDDDQPLLRWGADHIDVDINEGDSVTLEATLTITPGIDIYIDVALTSGNEYPKLEGGLETRTLHFAPGSTSTSLTLQTLNDDLLNDTVPIKATIVPNPIIRVGIGAQVATVNVRDGSYVDELDADGNTTGNKVFDPDHDAINLSWNHCRGGANRATLTVQEDAGNVPLQLYLYNGTASAIPHTWLIINNNRIASEHNDYTVTTTVVQFQPGQLVADVNIKIVDRPHLEDTESFVLSLFDNGSIEDQQYNHRCGVIEIFIEDDDTAQMEIAAEASQVDEGDDIVLTIQATDHATYDCLIGIEAYYEVTPTGDTAGLVSSNAKIVRSPPCNPATATFATADDSSVTANRTITFTVTRIGTAADFSTTDDRLLLPTSGVDVTVEEDDS